MVAYMTGKEIYLHTSWFEFLCARIKKKNKHIHWISQFKKKVEGIIQLEKFCWTYPQTNPYF